MQTPQAPGRGSPGAGFPARPPPEWTGLLWEAQPDPLPTEGRILSMALFTLVGGRPSFSEKGHLPQRASPACTKRYGLSPFRDKETNLHVSSR